MNAATKQIPGVSETSVGAKLLNLFVSPSLVFDEVVTAPSRPVNWLAPILIISLSGLIALQASANPERIADSVRSLLDAGGLSTDQAAALVSHWKLISAGALCISAFFGTVWSAFLLWFIGRIFLKARFPFWKALEVAGLSGTILILGLIVQSLLIAATGDDSARPALSLLCSKLEPRGGFHAAAAVVDCFHLWSTGVLAIGLSRLASVTVKESLFWVFGYFFVLRLALVLLA